MKIFGYELRKIKKEKIVVIRNNFILRDFVSLQGDGWESYDYDFFPSLLNAKIELLLRLGCGLEVWDISRILEIFLADAGIIVKYQD